MELFYPLGLLGLLGIVVLIIIYLIKPNYQQKIISSTLVWKLSQKYRRKKIPINKFRNLLILLCQVLIITMAAVLLARPILPDTLARNSNERIAIIDASASMLAVQSNGLTRFENAVEQVKGLGKEALQKNDRITVILADQDPHAILVRANRVELLEKTLNELVEKDSMGLPVGCSFGEVDVDSAMNAAQVYLNANPVAKARFYTATDYEYDNTNQDKDSFKVVNIDTTTADKVKPWNVAILNCTTTFEDNYFKFAVEVASFNKDMEQLNVYLHATGVNGNDEEADAENDPVMVTLDSGLFDNNSYIVNFNDLQINSYKSIYIYVIEEDSFPYDNNYYIYGGEKEILRITYFSYAHNTYYNTLMSTISDSLSSRWDIYSTRSSLSNVEPGQTISGSDIYIFEQSLPDVLPTDGIVLMINPRNAPSNSGFRCGETINRLIYSPELNVLEKTASSTLIDFIQPDKILVNEFTEIYDYSAYDVLMTTAFNGISYPMYLLQNTNDKKFIVLPFISYYSDFTLLPEFPTILYNMVNCLLPATAKQYIYDINETLAFDQNETVLSEMTPTLNISGGWASNETTVHTSDYGKISKSIPGVYTITQTMLSKNNVNERIFIRVSDKESQFNRKDTLTVPIAPNYDYLDFDMYIIFAAILCGVIFIERLLHVREEF